MKPFERNAAVLHDQPAYSVHWENAGDLPPTCWLYYRVSFPANNHQ